MIGVFAGHIKNIHEFWLLMTTHYNSADRPARGTGRQNEDSEALRREDL